MDKLNAEYQNQFTGRQFTNGLVFAGISKNVKLHDEIKNVRSSAAACINVFGYLNQHQSDIIPFFKVFGLQIDEILQFPQNADLSGEIYDDKGPIVFEWIGPKKSPINEAGGSRGQNRTSIDAYLLAKINGITTQLLIEWKFTETYNSESFINRFGGKKGVERLKRYSEVLVQFRKNGFPFEFKEEGGIGLSDFSYEPLYQLLRITLLAKMTTPMQIGELNVQDYRVIHLTHSENKSLNILSEQHLKYSPALSSYKNMDLHDVWQSILSSQENNKHVLGFWNKALNSLSENEEKKYLQNRYE